MRQGVECGQWCALLLSKIQGMLGLLISAVEPAAYGLQIKRAFIFLPWRASPKDRVENNHSVALFGRWNYTPKKYAAEHLVSTPCLVRTWQLRFLIVVFRSISGGSSATVPWKEPYWDLSLRQRLLNMEKSRCHGPEMESLDAEQEMEAQGP